MMSEADFGGLVAAMRHAQKRYFRTRHQHDLAVARDAERRVDDALSPPESVTPFFPEFRGVREGGGGAR